MLTTSEIIKKYNLYTKKSLGQNFLLHSDLIRKIVKCAGNLDGFEVLEVGTGPGGLTTAILQENVKKLVTIDTDERCINIVNSEIKPYFSNLECINADALLINENTLFSNKYKIIANLPYNIGTVLLMKWLENNINKIDSITLLLQKEVVNRIIAQPRTKEYGRLSIICQYLCDVKRCFDIAPTAFIPQPKVISSVIHLIPKPNINLNIIKQLSHLTQILFSQRRKTIANNLKLLTSNSENILKQCNISSNVRSEELLINDFIRILEECYKV